MATENFQKNQTKKNPQGKNTRLQLENRENKYTLTRQKYLITALYVGNQKYGINKNFSE